MDETWRRFVGRMRGECIAGMVVLLGRRRIVGGRRRLSSLVWRVYLMVGIGGMQEMLFVRVYWRDSMRTYLMVRIVLVYAVAWLGPGGVTCVLSESDTSSLTEWDGVTLERESC